MDRKCFNFPHMCLVEDGKFALNKFSIIPLLHKKMIEKIVIIRDKIVNSLYKTFSLHLSFPSLGGWFWLGLCGKFHPPPFPSHQTMENSHFPLNQMDHKHDNVGVSHGNPIGG